MRTDVSTLNPECFHPRTRRASARRRRSRLWRRQAGAAGHGGNAAIGIDFQCVNVSHGLPRRMAELAEKRPVVAEIYPQSSRNREYPLPVRDIGKHFTIEAMSKQQGSLLSATGTTTTSPARKRYKKLGFTVRATDTGKSLLEVAAWFDKLTTGLRNFSMDARITGRQYPYRS